GKYEMNSVLAFIRIWAQNKTENRFGWSQALNRVVSRGERSTGSILFLAFPPELIVKLRNVPEGSLSAYTFPSFMRDPFTPTLVAGFFWLTQLTAEDRSAHSCSN